MSDHVLRLDKLLQEDSSSQGFASASDSSSSLSGTDSDEDSPRPPPPSSRIEQLQDDSKNKVSVRPIINFYG